MYRDRLEETMAEEEEEEQVKEGLEKNYYHEVVAIIRGTGHDTNYFGQCYKNLWPLNT